MLPYRPALLNNRLRMFIAAFLAVVFHGGLIFCEFSVKPFFAPRVSFPRSMNVFLHQKKAIVIPGKEPPLISDRQHMKKEVSPPEKPEPHMAAATNVSAVKDRADNTFQPQVAKEKIIQRPGPIAERQSEPAVGEIVPAYQKSKNSTEGRTPDTGSEAESGETAGYKGIQAARKAAETKGALAVQMAYPRYQVNIPPAYPGLARKRGLEGLVILQVLVNSKGVVDDLRIETSSGAGLLDRAAVAAVRKWRFEPGRRDGEKVPMWVRVPVNFRLQE